MGPDPPPKKKPHPHPSWWVMPTGTLIPVPGEGGETEPSSALVLPPGGHLESCCGRSSPSGGPRILASLWRSCSPCCGRGTGWTGPRTALQSCEAPPPPPCTIQSSPSALRGPRPLPSGGPSPTPGAAVPLTLPLHPQVRADAGVLARGALSAAHFQAAGGGARQGPAGRL